jgi:hypothetical protein
LSVRLSAMLILVLAMTAIASGCGGGGGADDASTAPISKAEFIKKADAICTEGGKRTQAKFAAFAKENKISEGEELTTAQWEGAGTEVIVPALERQAEEVRQLGIPVGDEAQIEGFLEGVEEAVEKIEEDPKLAKSAPKLLADAHQAIKGYGFKVCGPEEE